MQRYSGVLLALGACLAGLVIALLVHEHAQGHRRHTRGGAPGDPSLNSIHDIGTMMRIMRYLDPEDRDNLSRVDRHNRERVQSVRNVVFDVSKKPRVYEIKNVTDFSPDGQMVLNHATDTGKQALFITTLPRTNTQTAPHEYLLYSVSQFVHEAVSPDNQRVVSCHIDGSVCIWDIVLETCIQTFKPQLNASVDNAMVATFSPTGTQIVVGGMSGRFYIYRSDPDVDNNPVQQIEPGSPSMLLIKLVSIVWPRTMYHLARTARNCYRLGSVI